MLAIILPFFLAAHVAVHEDSYPTESDWQRYSLESTYDVLVNMSLANINREKDNFCSMIGCELKCQPKGSDTLTCRFANAKVVRPDPGDSRCSNARNFVPISDKFVNEDPFEVRFNERGIENLVVARDIPRWRLDMIRDIVGQLNVGFELENGLDRFVTMENSSIGYCEVEVKVSRAGYGRGGRVVGDERFDIAFELEPARVVPLSRTALKIEKIRQPKKCRNRKVHFFGRHEDLGTGNESTFMDVTASVSQMHISNKMIHSYTESMGIMKTLNNPRTMHIRQEISLSLKSIDAARSALPDIPNPASTSLYA